jgi:hypothetical protein
MPRITVNFAQTGDEMRKRADETLDLIADLREALERLGIPSEDPETGRWDGDLAKSFGYLDEITSFVQEQRSRNRESVMGRS